MTVFKKGPKTQRTNGNLGRRLPNRDGVALLVTNGVAVAGGVQLNTVYRLLSPNDLAALKIDAAYDTANKVLVHRHVTDAFLYNPSIELYLFVAPQKVSTTEITPAVLCDKANDYVKKAINDMASRFNASLKLLAVAYNPSATYTATVAAGIDNTAPTAKAKLHELLNEFADDYKFVSAFLEARSYSGVNADLVTVNAISSNLAAPRISFVISADKEVSNADALYNGYANVGAALGMASSASISENFGNPIERFNLTNVANGRMITPGLSGNRELPTDNVVKNDIMDKGYIFATPITGIDGIYFTDTRTCVPVSDDYAYIENNRVIDKMLLLARTALLPLTTNARLQVDTNSGELTVSQKALLEGSVERALDTMVSDGDLSGGVTAVVPSGINLLAGEELVVEITAVPVAIGRAITITAGFNNPFSNN
jgi:hypothetical protein